MKKGLGRNIRPSQFTMCPEPDLRGARNPNTKLGTKRWIEKTGGGDLPEIAHL